MKIVEWLKEKKEDLFLYFSPDCADGSEDGVYPSYVTALFRLLVNYVHFVYPVLWVVMLVGCILEKLPFIGVIITSLIAAVLALAAIVLVLFLLMALESFAKLFASLLLTGKLPPDENQNPIDDFLMMLFRGV